MQCSWASGPDMEHFDSILLKFCFVLNTIDNFKATECKTRAECLRKVYMYARKGNTYVPPHGIGVLVKMVARESIAQGTLYLYDWCRAVYLSPLANSRTIPVIQLADTGQPTPGTTFLIILKLKTTPNLKAHTYVPGLDYRWTMAGHKDHQPAQQQLASQQ